MTKTRQKHQGGIKSDENALSSQFNAANQNKPSGFTPRTEGQRLHAQLLDETDITFSVGAAGTGKTHVAVAKACQEFKDGKVKKIVISRPVTPVGEGIGFVPGDKNEKMSDWLIPIYDEIDRNFGIGKRKSMIESGGIEIIPLSHVRGRTLKNTFVVIDEAQNCTYKDLFTIITRYGEGSKMSITGDPDPDQIDLLPVSSSGLKAIIEDMEGVSGVAVHRYSIDDCVRHPTVKAILKRRADKIDGGKPKLI